MSIPADFNSLLGIQCSTCPDTRTPEQKDLDSQERELQREELIRAQELLKQNGLDYAAGFLDADY